MFYSESSQDIRGLFTKDLKENWKEPEVNFKSDELRDGIFFIPVIVYIESESSSGLDEDGANLGNFAGIGLGEVEGSSSEHT